MLVRRDFSMLQLHMVVVGFHLASSSFPHRAGGGFLVVVLVLSVSCIAAREVRARCSGVVVLLFMSCVVVYVLCVSFSGDLGPFSPNQGEWYVSAFRVSESGSASPFAMPSYESLYVGVVLRSPRPPEDSASPYLRFDVTGEFSVFARNVHTRYSGVNHLVVVCSPILAELV